MTRGSSKQHLHLELCVAIPVLLFCAAACSSAPRAPQPESGSWLKQGSIVIAGPLPAASSPSARTLLGFLPADLGAHGVWLSINTGQGLARLMRGDTEIQAVKIQAASDIKPGTYELLHKQKDALWRASDEYFTNRGLPVPPPGNQNRYLRGALGEFVLYLDRDTPLHNAPAWSKEVGGIQLSDDDIARLYYRLEVGTLIEVN